MAFPKPRSSRGWAYWWLIPVVLGVLLVLVCESAFARAGGGHSFSGSSSSRGSSRGGSGGGSFEVQLLLNLVIEYPMVGIPLLLAVAFFAYRTSQMREEFEVEQTIQRGLPMQKERDRNRALASLQARDPGFQESVFLGRMKKAFRGIQAGWSQGDLQSAQAFLSDGVYERFSLQIQEYRELGIRDHLENLSILDTRITQVFSDAHFDAIHVLFRASAVNYRIDAVSGKHVDGSTAFDTFEEVWSFLRRPSAQTLMHPGLMEGFCPNCSAPVQLARAATCQVCQSYLRSGEHDWVLAEITQAGEWVATETSSIPGLAAYQAEDPAFSVQHVEDLASVVFFRRALAQRRRSVEHLRRFALDRYCQELSQVMCAPGTEKRPFFGECAVGSVDLRGVEVGADMDRLFMEIRWTGRPYELQPGGPPRSLGDFIPPARNVFIFLRRHGVKTDPKPSLSSAHCAACGAPEKSLAATCEYCGTVQNDGSSDWVLERVTNASDPDVAASLKAIRLNGPSAKPALVPKPPPAIAAGTRVMPDAGPAPQSPAGDAAMFASGLQSMRWLIAMMLADGIIDDKEQAMLEEFGEKCGVSPSVIEETVAMMQTMGVNLDSMDLPATKEEGMAILQNMVGMALADGHLADEEVTTLIQVGLRLGLGRYDVKMIINREKKRLYELAREALKDIRRQQRS